jgi:hypothetical protein
MSGEEMEAFMEIIDARLMPFLVDCDTDFSAWTFSWKRIMKARCKYGLLNELHRSFENDFNQILTLFDASEPGNGLPYLIKCIKFFRTTQATMSSWDIIDLELIQLWVEGRYFSRELVRGGSVNAALEMGRLCSNSFFRLQSFLVDEYPRTKLSCRTDLISPQSDWKDWFLLNTEFAVVKKYSGVIQAIDFTFSLGCGHVIDCDSVRMGIVYLCCNKLESLINNLQGSFVSELKSEWLADIKDVKERLGT